MVELGNLWATTLEVLQREYERSLRRDLDAFPVYSEGGKWLTQPVTRRSSWSAESYDHGNWMSGFWFGQVWILAHGTGDSDVAETWRERLHLLDEKARDHTTHDLGFVFYPGVVLPRQLGLIEDSRTSSAAAAADMTVRRYNERGGYIQAFGAIGHERGAGTSTIDTMMNLPLLWWASERRGILEAHIVARTHARTSARTFVRPESSTFQLNTYEPITGALLSQGTFQGATEGSCWSRGQAWAASGFAWAFAATRESELLTAAERTIAYFVSRLGDDGVPPWDFAATDDDEPRDAGATAITAVGTAILAWFHPDEQAREGYRRQTDQLLVALSNSALNVDGTADGVILKSTYSRPHGLGIDGATPWGDFYFCLALLIRRQRTKYDAELLLGIGRERSGR